jgi:hypothetical protein
MNTAADANHSSFGCEDKAKWTYFGDAFFFNAALRRAKNNPMRYICEIFGAPRFSSFSTQSVRRRHRPPNRLGLVCPHELSLPMG